MKKEQKKVANQGMKTRQAKKKSQQKDNKMKTYQLIKYNKAITSVLGRPLLMTEKDSIARYQSLYQAILEDKLIKYKDTNSVTIDQRNNMHDEVLQSQLFSVLFIQNFNFCRQYKASRLDSVQQNQNSKLIILPCSAPFYIHKINDMSQSNTILFNTISPCYLSVFTRIINCEGFILLIQSIKAITQRFSNIVYSSEEFVLKCQEIEQEKDLDELTKNLIVLISYDIKHFFSKDIQIDNQVQSSEAIPQDYYQYDYYNCQQQHEQQSQFCCIQQYSQLEQQQNQNSQQSTQEYNNQLLNHGFDKLQSNNSDNNAEYKIYFHDQADDLEGVSNFLNSEFFQPPQQ